MLQLARDAFLGTSLAFYTTAGSIFCLKGMEDCSWVKRMAVDEIDEMGLGIRNKSQDEPTQT